MKIGIGIAVLLSIYVAALIMIGIIKLYEFIKDDLED